MNHRPLKITGGALVVLAAAYVGASWYAGQQAQQRIEAWVTQANQDIAAQWHAQAETPTLKIAAYDRGLLHSRIRYVLAYHDEQGAAHELGLTDALQHGPWPLAALRAGHWAPLAAYSRVVPEPGGDWEAWTQVMPQGEAPWVLRSRIAFSGAVDSEARIAPVKTDAVDFGGGTLQLHYLPQSRETQLLARFDRLELRDAAAGTVVKLGGAELRGRSRFDGESDRQSHQTLKLARLDLEAQVGGAIALLDQVFALDVAQTGSLMDSQVRYDAAHLRLSDQDLGKLQAQASVQNIAVPALQSLSRTLAQVDAAHAPDTDLSPQEQQQVRAALLPFLAAAPRFSVRTLQWANAQGTTALSAQADFRPAPEDAPADLAQTVERSIRELALHVQISKPMLLQVLRQGQPDTNSDTILSLFSMIFDQSVARLERMGLARSSGQGVVQSDLRYADGQVTVNGATMSPAEFARRLDFLLGGAF